MSYSPPPPGFQVPAAQVLRLGTLERIVLSGIGGLLIGLLVTAARLPPHPQGMGTHQALGLPPCTLVSWYGIRCPSCGMTTAWAHLTKGHAWAAFRANAGGALLCLVALIFGPWALVSGAWGRWIVPPPSEWIMLGFGLVIVAVTFADWAVRLSLGW